MKWASVVAPDAPYPLIAEEPASLYQITRFFRPSDRLVWAGVTVGVPGLLYALERFKSPTMHPRHLNKALAFVVPFSWLAGYSFALVRTHARFWGLSENAREQEMYAAWTAQRKSAATPRSQGYHV